jgi:crossover junction endodeoxyribonuclease RuvC
VRVLGIDPGMAVTGYGLLEISGESSALIESGAITTASSLPLPRRLREIYHEVGDLICRVRPQTAAVEKLFFNANVRTAMSVGQARGVVLLALDQAGVPVHEYTPLEVKQFVVGYGRATKRQVQEMVRAHLRLEAIPQPDDAADAIAVALCHLQNARWVEAVEKGER